jgi:hypothetical protein
MSATQTAKQNTQTFTVERPDVNAKIFITKYGVGGTTDQYYSYDAVRYSYHIEKQRDGQTIITEEYGGFRNWEDALNDAQWGIDEL